VTLFGKALARLHCGVLRTATWEHFPAGNYRIHQGCPDLGSGSPVHRSRRYAPATQPGWQREAKVMRCSLWRALTPVC